MRTIPQPEAQAAKAQATRLVAWAAMNEMYPMAPDDLALVAAGAIDALYQGFHEDVSLMHIAQEAAHETAQYLIAKDTYSPDAWQIINNILGL